MTQLWRPKGVLSDANIGSLLSTVRSAGPNEEVVYDLQEVDRVEYGALAQSLIVTMDVAERGSSLTVMAPAATQLPNEARRLNELRSAARGSTEYYAGISAQARWRRRQELRREFIELGYFVAMEEAFELVGGRGELRIKGASEAHQLNFIDELSAESDRASLVRRVPFRWSSIQGAGRSATVAHPFGLADLKSVLSQGQAIVGKYDADSVHRYVVEELIQNVQDHAYDGESSMVRPVLVGAVAMWPTQDFESSYGSDGSSVYRVPELAGDEARPIAQLVIADHGVGIPATLPISPERAKRVRDWASGLRARVTKAEMSVVWSFHPLSTKRPDNPEGKRGLRGLSYVLAQAQNYGGTIRTRSGTGTVQWDLDPGRSVATANRAHFPGTCMTVTLPAQRVSEGETTRVRGRLGAPSIVLEPVSVDALDDVFDLGARAYEGASEADFVLFCMEPSRDGKSSRDKTLASVIGELNAATLASSTSLPWACAVPFTSGDAYALLGTPAASELSDAEQESVGLSLPKRPVLLLTLDGEFLWIGGTTDERRTMARTTGLGRLSAGATEVAGLDDSERQTLLGEMDVLDALQAQVQSRLTTALQEPNDVVGMEAEPTLLDSLLVAMPWVEPGQVIAGLHLETACAISLRSVAREALGRQEVRFVHTSSLPAALASLLDSSSVGDHLVEALRASSNESGPLAILDGLYASGDSLRGQASQLVKGGSEVLGVFGLMNCSSDGRRVMRTVFREIPLHYLAAASTVRSADGGSFSAERSFNMTTARRARDLVSGPLGFDLGDLLEEHPQAVRVGHFVRRAGRHMDLFVDFGRVFGSSPNRRTVGGSEDESPSDRGGFAGLERRLLNVVAPWQGAERDGREAPSSGQLVVAYPDDDAMRAGQFAEWVAGAVERLVETRVPVVPIHRHLGLALGEQFESPPFVILADWGAVTAGSLHEMLVNLATARVPSTLAVVLSSQLSDEREVVERSIRAVQGLPTSIDDSRSSMSVSVDFLSRLDLGYSIEPECRLCAVRASMSPLADVHRYGPTLSSRATARFDALAPLPLPPRGEAQTLHSESSGPALVRLRSRLEKAKVSSSDKLELLQELRKLVAESPFDYENPEVRAWLKLVVLEPGWMAGSAIDIDLFRVELVKLCDNSLRFAVQLAGVDRRDAQQEALLALRVCGKDAFLRRLPHLAAEVDSEEVLLDGLLHVATMLERPYHHTSEALDLVEDTLTRLVASLRNRSVGALPPDGIGLDFVEARSALHVLEQRVEELMARLDAPTERQDAWHRLRLRYVTKMRRHEGLEPYLDPLIANAGSARLRRVLGSPDRSRTASAVETSLRGPWAKCARRINEDVLPVLDLLSPQLSAILDQSLTSSAAGWQNSGASPELQLWETRLLGARPLLAVEIETILHKLESGGDPDTTLRSLHQVLMWLYECVLKPPANGGALLLNAAESVPLSLEDANAAIEAAAGALALDRSRCRLPEASGRVFFSSVLWEVVVRQVLDNAVIHRRPEVDPDQINIQVGYEDDGLSARFTILNSSSDPHKPSPVGGRRGLAMVTRTLDLFGGRLAPVPEEELRSQSAGREPYTFGIALNLPVWRVDAVEAT